MRIVSVTSEELSEVKLINTGLYCPCLMDTHRSSRENERILKSLFLPICIHYNPHVLIHEYLILAF